MTETESAPAYQDPAHLRAEYRGCDGDKSMQELADAYGVASSTIEYWLDKHDLAGPMRTARKRVSVTEATKERLDAANREGERLSDTIGRALDALEGEA